MAIFINQLRDKVGVIYGSHETTAGGRALKYYATVRIDIRRIETLKNGTEMIGSRTRAKVVKNKVAPPFRDAEFDIMYGKGVSRVGEIIDLGVKCDIVQKSGAWFSYNGDRLGQGRDNSKIFLSENPALAAEIEGKIRAVLQGNMKEEPAEKKVPSPASPASTPAAESAPIKKAAPKVNIDITVDD